MTRIPFAVSMLGVALFAFGCEKRQGDDCSALCTDVFESCQAECEGGDDENCVVVCEDNNEVCLGGCDVSDEADAEE